MEKLPREVAVYEPIKDLKRKSIRTEELTALLKQCELPFIVTAWNNQYSIEVEGPNDHLVLWLEEA